VSDVVWVDPARASELAHALDAAARWLGACGSRPPTDLPSAVLRPLLALTEGADIVANNLAASAAALGDAVAGVTDAATQADRW
jgi:hypothetical protein